MYPSLILSLSGGAPLVKLILVLELDTYVAKNEYLVFMI